jgi:FkbM family methyltransferase
MIVCRMIKNWVKRAVNKVLWRSRLQILRPWDSNMLNSVFYKHYNVDFFFIQVGANDGRSYDPIYELVTQHELAGLAIEPLPDMYELLKNTYLKYPKVRTANFAIHRTEKEVTLYRVRANADVADWAHGIASLDPSHHHRSNTRSDLIVAEKVPALSLKEVFERFGIKKFDFLQVDAEGYDAEIIRMLLETDIRPNIIQFEYGYGNMCRKELLELVERLFESGYWISMQENDCIAYR